MRFYLLSSMRDLCIYPYKDTTSIVPNLYIIFMDVYVYL